MLAKRLLLACGVLGIGSGLLYISNKKDESDQTTDTTIKTPKHKRPTKGHKENKDLVSESEREESVSHKLYKSRKKSRKQLPTEEVFAETPRKEGKEPEPEQKNTKTKDVVPDDTDIAVVDTNPVKSDKLVEKEENPEPVAITQVQPEPVCVPPTSSPIAVEKKTPVKTEVEESVVVKEVPKRGRPKKINLFNIDDEVDVSYSEQEVDCTDCDVDISNTDNEDSDSETDARKRTIRKDRSGVVA